MTSCVNPNGRNRLIRLGVQLLLILVIFFRLWFGTPQETDSCVTICYVNLNLWWNQINSKGLDSCVSPTNTRYFLNQYKHTHARTYTRTWKYMCNYDVDSHSVDAGGKTPARSRASASLGWASRLRPIRPGRTLTLITLMNSLIFDFPLCNGGRAGLSKQREPDDHAPDPPARASKPKNKWSFMH